MGPERILPNCDDELVQDQPVDAALPVEGGGGGGEEWSGEDAEEDPEGGGGGYYYQPLNQEPDGVGGLEPDDQVDQVNQRIEALGLHLPEAPPPYSDEEADPEGVVVERSHASIPMDPDHVELVKRTMALVALPSLGVPAWARELSEDQWNDMVEHTLQTRQSSAALTSQSPAEATLTPESPAEATLTPESPAEATLTPESPTGAALTPQSPEAAALTPQSPEAAALTPQSPGVALTPQSCKNDD